MRLLPLRRPLRSISACLLAGALAAGCGGGGGGGEDGGDAGAGQLVLSQAGCDFQYSPDGPPLQAGADPLLQRQWHLRNQGQGGGRPGEDLRAIDAWDLGIKGDAVRVAIVDDAIETLHEDLFPNVAAFVNYRRGAARQSAPLPCDANDDHGTAVAGIVAARDGNGVGVAGVAPRARLAAYNALASGTEADVSDALRQQTELNAVYNNSWGSRDDGVLHASGDLFRATIEQGVANGRSGRGSIYVFPAGNGGCFRNQPRCFDDNANFDGFVNQFGVIAVCPVDDQGRSPSYAEPGANILVCGPTNGGSSGITTTTVRSSYRDDFSGTSASTPMISGVVALMLQENPALTWRDVRLILARSARKNDTADAGWQANAAGLRVHPFYGFGVADAANAVRTARGWTSVGGSGSLKRCEYARGNGAAPFPLAIADVGATLSDSVTVGAECAIAQLEFVEVAFSAVHGYSGDLRIELLRPGSPDTVLAHERLCGTTAAADGVLDCGDYQAWRFASVRHLDEAPAGTWTLNVSDRLAGDTGQWVGWTLTLWGR